ncbi:MAG: dihydroneopterin aldolase [Actinomycetota bacterium]
MPQIIHLRGIRTEGRHGASRGEQDAAQPLLVDLEMDVEALNDDLGTTADYRVVVYAVQELVAKKSLALIETIAEHVAEAVVEVPGVRWCKATVHKPRAAERLGAADVSASAEAGGR